MTRITPPGGRDAGSPTFSLVIPVYNVEAFLPAFLDSLDRQTPPPTDCELIFVDDGSADGSVELIRAWVARTGQVAEVVDQPNQGPAVARNSGLERASGTWVSFPDPDDVLDRDYLRKVREFIAAHSVEADLVGTHAMILDDETGDVSDTHPLHRRFRQGTRLVDLEGSPDDIHRSVATGFFRRDRIEDLGLRFDASIRPEFEDASFTALYLMAAQAPRVGIVADARYLHRIRSDASSLSQRSWLEEDKYTTVLERGYLALLRRATEERGSVPVWVQNLVLYDLLSYFRRDLRTSSPTGLAPEAWTDRFHALAEEVLRYIDVETIERFAVMPTSRQLKESLVIGYKGQRTVPASIALAKLDADQRLVQLRYFFGGSPPDEDVSVGGQPARPAYAKTRDVTYFNRVLLHERIAWLPATADLRVSINGRRMPLAFDAPSSVSKTQRAKSAIRNRFPDAVRRIRGLQQSVLGRPPSSGQRAPARYRTSPFADLDPRLDARLVRDAHGRRARERYAQAWTFMDRDTEAHDNAEHLYRYVRQRHPEVNAWFVLRRDAGDWDRLAAEGFRLVPFGSPEHVQLLLNTDHLVSSQVDNYVVRPLDPARFGRRAWRFTFLDHGVTQNDLSRWFNTMPIDRFITVSPAEHASIVDDHTPYVFTEKEVRLTGFPRHDRLLELKRGVERPSLILVTPTWRRWLLATATTGNARALVRPLAETDFGRSWFDLVGSAELRGIAEESGLEIALLPHPNLQAHIGRGDVPPWVTIHTYDMSDVQDLLVRAAVTVTDYSSQAFEAAYLECPVVYYQFDRAEFDAGTHIHRRGSWDYEPDGFGPVVLDRDAALEAIRDAVVRVAPAEPYLTRMRATFPHHDGRCCQRTFESIISLTSPVTAEEAVQFVGGDRHRADAHGDPDR